MEKKPETIVFNKLVRDKIPGIIASTGSKVTFRALKDVELRDALRQKLLEEANELAEAKTKEAMAEEIGDIYEVIKAMQMVFDIGLIDIEASMARKGHEKGHFDKGYFLERAEVRYD